MLGRYRESTLLMYPARAMALTPHLGTGIGLKTLTIWHSKDLPRSDGMRDSPIFDPETGFGGDGVLGTHTLPENYSTFSPSKVPINPSSFKGCVQDGRLRF